jgi:hypothetical protein
MEYQYLMTSQQTARDKFLKNTVAKKKLFLGKFQRLMRDWRLAQTWPVTRELQILTFLQR